MQGSFSFIKTSRKNAAYRVKVEKDLVPPALALQPIVQRDGKPDAQAVRLGYKIGPVHVHFGTHSVVARGDRTGWLGM